MQKKTEIAPIIKFLENHALQTDGNLSDCQIMESHRYKHRRGRQLLYRLSKATNVVGADSWTIAKAINTEKDDNYMCYKSTKGIAISIEEDKQITKAKVWQATRMVAVVVIITGQTSSMAAVAVITTESI